MKVEKGKALAVYSAVTSILLISSGIAAEKSGSYDVEDIEKIEEYVGDMSIMGEDIDVSPVDPIVLDWSSWGIRVTFKVYWEFQERDAWNEERWTFRMKLDVIKGNVVANQDEDRYQHRDNFGQTDSGDGTLTISDVLVLRGSNTGNDSIIMKLTLT